jgi:hypothetical protein
MGLKTVKEGLKTANQKSKRYEDVNQERVCDGVSMNRWSFLRSWHAIHKFSNSTEMELHRVQRLKECLLSSTIRHEEQILLQPSLKDAHIYCVLHNLSAQQYGPLLEKYIISKYNYTKNNASQCIGDCSKNNKNLEVKASLGGSHHQKFNYVQIRIAQPIHDYLLTAYHLHSSNVEQEGELYLFRIPKTNMKQLLVSHGGYAHGTFKEYGRITPESLEDTKNTKEYAIRPTIHDKCWKDLLPFRIVESDL